MFEIHKRGFTLIELSVVLIIIGILLAAGYNRYESSINSAKIVDTVSILNNLSSATKEYKAKFRSLPGDDPTASTSMSGLAATENGNGNGEVEIAELMLVSKHLSIAGITKGGQGNLLMAAPFSGQFGRIWIVSAALATSGNSPCSGGTPVNNSTPLSNARNVVLFENLPGDVAMAIDQKLDDGVFNTGNIRGSAIYGTTVVPCLASWIN